MKKLKAFFRLVFSEDVKGSYARVVIATVIFAAFTLFLELTNCFNGLNFPTYMGEVFADPKFNGCTLTAYIFYHLGIYTMIIFYSYFAIQICLKKHDMSWCVLVILISLIFIIVESLYLSVFLQATKTEELKNVMTEMYKSLISCCVTYATILSGIAGIKMTLLYGKSKDGFVPRENVELGAISGGKMEISDNSETKEN